MYVGISHHPATRLRQHAKDKPWWASVARHVVAWRDTRAEASLEEQQVVEEECPRHNTAMPPWRVPDPPLAHLSSSERAAAWEHIESLRRDMNAARAALFAGIREHLKAGRGPSEIGRSVDWSREYIAKIRDGKVKD